jgi:hypothetical protein
MCHVKRPLSSKIKGNIIPKTHTVPQHKDITLSTSTDPTPTLVPGTGKDDVNITDEPKYKENIPRH